MTKRMQQDDAKTEAKKAVRSLWDLGGLTPRQLLKRVGKEFNEDDILGRSAQLSYYFLLALFPAMLFLMTIFGMLAGPGSELRESMMGYLAKVMPGSAFDLVNQTTHQVHQAAGGWKLAVGIVGTLWSASAGLTAIMDTLNVAYEYKETRSFVRKRLVAIVLTLALAALVISALVIVLYGGAIAEWVGRMVGLSSPAIIAWKIVQWPIALAFLAVAFALVYYFAPNHDEPEWNWITPGAVMGLFLWIGASLAFRLYLSFFNSYSATYGSVGAVIILMLWFYLSSIAILLGGEINSEIGRAQEGRERHDARMRELQERPAA